MCSIVVTFNESNRHTLKKMLERVSHRGPDTMEIYNDTPHGIGACRLSVFGDEQAPMAYRDPVTGRMILLNGEIYNYDELSHQLYGFGHQARTNLEAELVGELFDVYGSGFAQHLKGMFAIVIIDARKMILARDSFGIKPLYYARVDRKVIVSSEIKGILAHPDVSPSLHLDSLEETSVFGYVADQEATFFDGVRQIEPGSVVTFGDDGSLETLRIADLAPARYLEGVDEVTYEEACQTARDRIIGTVQRMFNHGAMRKGVYLSGGLDSSTIALIARNLFGYDIETFSLADSSSSPDIIAARRVADALGTSHHEWLVGAGDYWKALPDYIAHYESLMAGGVFDIQGGIAFHLLSEKVAQNVRVAFSGEGADELFGGYNWIHTHPLGFSDGVRKRLAAIPPNLRLETMVNNLFPQPEDEKTYKRHLFDHLVRSGLSNFHLQSVDRSAGAFGFEIRPLYLYNDIADYALSLPIDYKAPDKMTTKRILRDAFRADFEEAGLDWVLTRSKLGMPAALALVNEEVTARVESTISDEELRMHQFGKVLGSKMNLLLYDLFEHIFFHGWEHQGSAPPHNSYFARVWPE